LPELVSVFVWLYKTVWCNPQCQLIDGRYKQLSCVEGTIYDPRIKIWTQWAITGPWVGAALWVRQNQFQGAQRTEKRLRYGTAIQWAKS